MQIRVADGSFVRRLQTLVCSDSNSWFHLSDNRFSLKCTLSGLNRTWYRRMYATRTKLSKVSIFAPSWVSVTAKGKTSQIKPSAVVRRPLKWRRKNTHRRLMITHTHTHTHTHSHTHSQCSLGMPCLFSTPSSPRDLCIADAKSTSWIHILLANLLALCFFFLFCFVFLLLFSLLQLSLTSYVTLCSALLHNRQTNMIPYCSIIGKHYRICCRL